MLLKSPLTLSELATLEDFSSSVVVSLTVTFSHAFSSSQTLVDSAPLFALLSIFIDIPFCKFYGSHHPCHYMIAVNKFCACEQMFEQSRFMLRTLDIRQLYLCMANIGKEKFSVCCCKIISRHIHVKNGL